MGTTSEIEAIVLVPQSDLGAATAKINADTFEGQVDVSTGLSGVAINSASTSAPDNNQSPKSSDPGTGNNVVSGGSSHGDPIIHTFKDDCYDLSKDGLYLASSHPDWTH